MVETYTSHDSPRDHTSIALLLPIVDYIFLRLKKGISDLVLRPGSR